jgi:hypothetical protein
MEATLVKDHKGKKKSAYHFNGTTNILPYRLQIIPTFDHNQDFTISMGLC